MIYTRNSIKNISRIFEVPVVLYSNNTRKSMLNSSKRTGCHILVSGYLQAIYEVFDVSYHVRIKHEIKVPILV